MFAATLTLPSLDYDIITENGEKGWVGTWFSNDTDGINATGEPIKTQVIDETSFMVSSSAPQGLTPKWTLRLDGRLKPREKDVDFEFGVTVAGRAKVRTSSSFRLMNR